MSSHKSTGSEVLSLLVLPVVRLVALLSSIGSWIGETERRCWLALSFAIVVEIVATSVTKHATDEGNMGTMTLGMTLYVFSLLSFAASMGKLDVSVAYAIWSAVGTAAVTVVGIFFFGESCSFAKTVSICLIIIGVVGLNLVED